jgi:hypothetical protein
MPEFLIELCFTNAAISGDNPSASLTTPMLQSRVKRLVGGLRKSSNSTFVGYPA